MARKVYLRDDEIRANHWYIDKKGEKLLYLGRALEKWQVSRPDGGTPVHLYLKESVLKRYYGGDLNLIHVQDMFDHIVSQKTMQYCISCAPRKFYHEDGAHPDAPLKGWVNIFQFL